MFPFNTSYPNPNRYSIRSRACYPWFPQGFASPIVYTTWSWPNYIPAQGRAQRYLLVSHYPSRPIYSSYGHCGWKGTGYSSQIFRESAESTHFGVTSQSTQLPCYTGRSRYQGYDHFDQNSLTNTYNDHRFHPAAPAYCHVLYARRNPATTNATRQLSSAYIQPSSTPVSLGNNARNYRDIVSLDPPVPPLLRPDIIDADEDAFYHFYDSFETQQLDDNPVTTSEENSPLAAQQSSLTSRCSCYHCTDMPFCDASSDQSDIGSASTFGTGDGWNSPLSPAYVSVEPVDSIAWNNNQGAGYVGSIQDPYFCQTTSCPSAYWPKRQEMRQQQPQGHFQYPATVPPQFYQRPMNAYGPNPKVLCQQQNYIGYHYVSGQYVQNNVMTNQQSVPYGTPLQVEIPEVSFVQRLTNEQTLESTFQQSYQMQDIQKGEDWNSNQMLLKICPDITPPIPRNSVPEVWEQDYEQLPNYADLAMPGSPRVSRYFPTVPVEYAEETYSTETKNITSTFSASSSPGTFTSNAHSLSVTTIQQSSTVSVHQSKYIPRHVPPPIVGLLAGGGIHHINEQISTPFFRHDAMERRVNGKLEIGEVNDHRSISLTSVKNYYDTHNQPDGVAGNSSTGTNSTPNGNVTGAASNSTMQREPSSQRNLGFSESPQTGGRVERDSELSNITLRTLLETPYSPRTRNTRNLELEEYQRILAEEELQKTLDALRAKEKADKEEKNGYTSPTMGTGNAED